MRRYAPAPAHNIVTKLGGERETRLFPFSFVSEASLMIARLCSLVAGSALWVLAKEDTRYFWLASSVTYTLKKRTAGGRFCSDRAYDWFRQSCSVAFMLSIAVGLH